MQYVIKQVRATGSAFWTGRDYVEDMDKAQFFNAIADADAELAELDKADRHNALVIGVEFDE